MQDLKPGTCLQGIVVGIQWLLNVDRVPLALCDVIIKFIATQHHHNVVAKRKKPREHMLIVCAHYQKLPSLILSGKFLGAIRF